MASKNPPTQQIITAKDFRGDLSPYLKKYTYQPDLTGRLDELGDTELTQDLINEIVLWKVNRYVSLSPELLRQIGQLRRLKPHEHKNGESVLTALLECHGIDLGWRPRSSDSATRQSSRSWTAMRTGRSTAPSTRSPRNVRHIGK